MATTMLQNMVDPQVLADMISAELENAIRFAPLARVDRTLEGRPGSTITVPKFKYIGDATDVAEGQEIDLALLETSTEDFTIKKAGKGVEITDEAVLSGYGDPIGEAGKQLLMAIANKVDNDVLTALDTTTLEYTAGTAWNLDTISGAMDIFNDEDDEPMVLILNPKDASKLRKAVASDWERASDLGDNIIVNGTYGGVLGAQVVRSKKVAEGTGYLVKQGALAIYMKRNVGIEDDRDILRKTTVFTADQHYGAHLYDESKAIKIKVEETGGGVEG
jgi:N4-gp56 family major capsid protein|nr:MAG TPA: major capsid protein [Caudoviricetes sp.]